MKIKKTKHFNEIAVSWLTAPDKHNVEIESNDEYITYPLPENGGTAGGNMLETPYQISVYHAKHNYNAGVLGERFKLGRFVGEYDSPSLNVFMTFSGYVERNDFVPEYNNTYSDELTLFRHADRFDFELFYKTAKPCEEIFFSLPIYALNLLIGTNNTQYLLSSLKINNPPSAASLSIPYRINKILKSAVSPHLKGRMKQLYSQTKVLEYLCELIEYIEQKKELLPPQAVKDNKARQVYELLSDLDGKLPDIIELAEEFGMSAQTLNQAFRKEFGLTIYRFMSKKRLDDVHITIEETKTPLKVLSSNLGYSHVNHFNAAFKREFGYSPGSLRRR